MQPSETAPEREPIEPVLVNISADPTARWCRVGRNPYNRDEVRALRAAHRARLRRVRLRGLLRWFKALLLR